MSDSTTLLSEALASPTSQCLLLVGAGFSKDATAASGALPDGTQLAAAFNSELHKSYSLAVAAYEYREAFGNDAYVEFLKNHFIVTSYPAEYGALTAKRWLRVYTTNYDNLCEKVLSCSPSAVVSPVNSGAAAASHAEVVHINGAIAHLTSSRVDSFKLSFTDYDRTLDEQLMYLFQRDLELSSHVIVCGYSLYDLDLRRALAIAKKPKERVLFVTRDDVSDENRVIYERYGVVVPIAASGFLDILAALPPAGPTTAPAALASPSFSLFSPDFGPPQVASNEEVFRLYTQGGVDARHFYLNRLQPKIVVERELATEVRQLQGNGERLVAIHSDVGNGKSAALQQVMLLLSESGTECYLYNGGTGPTLEELSYFNSSKKRICLFFDSELISPNTVIDYAERAPRVHVIYALRSVHIELRRSGGWEKLQSFAIYDLNVLRPSEVSQLSDIFDTYGLWGDISDRDRHRLFSTIPVDFRSVLLFLFNTAHVRASIEKSVKEITSVADYVRDLFVTLLLLSYFGLRPSNSYLQRLAGMSALAEFSAAVARDDDIAENIRYRDGAFRYYSPTYAEFVLREIIPDTTKIDVMLHLFERTLNFEVDVIRSLRITLMRFGAVAALFKESNRTDTLLSYYDALSRIGAARTNYLFWLQFAIACTAFGRFELAERYFDNAYRLAENSDPYQIDNHYSKFLLRSRMKRPDIYTDYAWALQEAHKLSLQQYRVRDEAKFPLEVFELYGEYIESTLRKLSNDELPEIVVLFDELAEELRSRRVPPNLAKLQEAAVKGVARGRALLSSR